MLLLLPVLLAAEPLAYSPALVQESLKAARESGSVERGALVFSDAKFACLSCHKVGGTGGGVGPDLTLLSTCITPEAIVESVLWPAREVKEGFRAVEVHTNDGKVRKGYVEAKNDTHLTLKDTAAGTSVKIPLADIEKQKDIGTLMPDGIAEAMTAEQRRDLVRFLLELGKKGVKAEDMVKHGHGAAKFDYVRDPLNPAAWPNWKHKINRDRVYDFYAKEAIQFAKTNDKLLPAFPGLDGGKQGHWGNQNDTVWADDRWNQMDLGTFFCGVLKVKDKIIPRAMCVRMGDYACAFNPDTLRYEAFWKGGFLKFSRTRSGFLDPLQPAGELLPLEMPKQTGVFHGVQRRGNSVTFKYTVGDIPYLDRPEPIDGRLVVTKVDARTLSPDGTVEEKPKPIVTHGIVGAQTPYALDTITPPFDNPAKSLLYFSGLDFMNDGSSMVCTMQGDVWHVTGIDEELRNVKWRRFASGLHQPLGLVVADGKVYVQCRDQIVRLHDADANWEADDYECFCNCFKSSPSGHDFICGLERDKNGYFYTASGNEGILKIAPDGKSYEVLATGLRNPDGLGLWDGKITAPSSEGDYVPASLIALINPPPLREGLGEGVSPLPPSPSPPSREGRKPHFGHGGPKKGMPDWPLLYLPRGLDNSSGGQVEIPKDNRWGPLGGNLIHFSYGTGSHFLVLKGGAAIPLPGEFLSGSHRGRFNPKDGQLYVVGMGGWGHYTPQDGCFHRVRYTGGRVQLPKEIAYHENGVVLEFTSPINGTLEGFAQAWNYRYSGAYGSPEYSPSHYGVKGHDRWAIKGIHKLGDNRVFLEIPEMQPVSQLHLRLSGDGPAVEVFGTVHALQPPLAGYPSAKKAVAAHPMSVDLAMAAKHVSSPYSKPKPNARSITIEAGKNLTFSSRELRAKPGEVLKVTFSNPDVVPHNWVLVKPGALERVGVEANKLIADADAVSRHYVPKSDDVIVWTEIVNPDGKYAIYFAAPAEKGRYPYLCTFPGHWMVMNGELVVE